MASSPSVSLMQKSLLPSKSTPHMAFGIHLGKALAARPVACHSVAHLSDSADSFNSFSNSQAAALRMEMRYHQQLQSSGLSSSDLPSLPHGCKEVQETVPVVEPPSEMSSSEVVPQGHIQQADSRRAYFSINEVSEYGRRSQAFQDKREQRLRNHAPRPNFPTEFAQFSNEVLLEPVIAAKYFDAALLQSPYDVQLLRAFASFSWRQLGDKCRAEELYQRALGEHPEDAENLASYALFLWESE